MIALDILRFDKYPEPEVDKLLDLEVKVRLLNLNSADMSDEEYEQAPPPLPTSFINSFL